MHLLLCPNESICKKPLESHLLPNRRIGTFGEVRCFSFSDASRFCSNRNRPIYSLKNSETLAIMSLSGSQTMFSSLRASPTVSAELKFPLELNSFCDTSRVYEPANESLFLVTCRFRKSTELFSLINKQSIVLRGHFALRQGHFAIRMK